MNRDVKIYVAGHSGLLGSALVRMLQDQGYDNVVTRSRAEMDLTDRPAVEAFLRAERPEYVFLAAGKVGGIWANDSYPAEFIYTNLAIQTSVVHGAYLAGVRRLVFFGSNCAYPKECSQPMREEYLLSGVLEPTSEPFAVAKLAGMKMCEAYNRQYGTCFVTLIPPTLYGPNDSFDSRASHVLSALIDRFEKAKDAGEDSVVVWGSGTPRREFLYVDDMADACLFVMNMDEGALADTLGRSGWVLNVGSGSDLTVMELAHLVRRVIGFSVNLVPDPSRPDGAARKLLDSGRIRQLGWSARFSLEEGVQKTYRWYLSHRPKVADGLR